MGSHIADIGFAYADINGQPAPNPAVATADAGWREFGSMDSAGTALDVSARCGDSGSCIQLTQAQVDAQYCNRAQIFASWNDWTGWDPLPEDTSDDACADPVIPGAVTWTGSAMSLGGSTTSVTGNITEQTDSNITFTADGGKFESSKLSTYFAYQELTGDFVISAKAKTIGLLRENGSYQFPTGVLMCVCDAAAATTGLMGHASLNDITVDTTVNLVATYGHIQTTAGSWNKTGTTDVTAGDNLYIQLERAGNSYTARYSTDGGATYSNIGGSSFTDTLPDTLKVGFFATPNNTGEQTFVYEDIQITQ